MIMRTNHPDGVGYAHSLCGGNASRYHAAENMETIKGDPQYPPRIIPTVFTQIKLIEGEGAYSVAGLPGDGYERQTAQTFLRATGRS
jgi:hypothetical protein